MIVFRLYALRVQGIASLIAMVLRPARMDARAITKHSAAPRQQTVDTMARA
jgi:hypothetical protein